MSTKRIRDKAKEFLADGYCEVGINPNDIIKMCDKIDALARKLAMIELTWDQCDGVPSRVDRDELHRLIINTEPHVDDELQALRRELGGSS